MRYGTVCSGIGAPETAWQSLGWECAFMSEIDAFPRAVLERHYQDVPLHGDFTTIGEKDYGPVDLICGGTPCQAFSIAGLRGGFDDERGNLTLEFVQLVERKKPRWVVWENVPGVLSIDGGRAFGSFLGGLAQCGYGFAYRVLDAQYFGVPQRRRRVFVVAHLGSWQRAAAVLFEPESLRGDITPCRETGEGAAGNVAEGAGGGFGKRFAAKTDRQRDFGTAEGDAGRIHMPEMRGGKQCDVVSDMRMVQSRTQYENEFSGDGESESVGFTKQGIGEYIDNNIGSALRARDCKGFGDLVMSFPADMSGTQRGVQENKTGALRTGGQSAAVCYGIPGNHIGRKPENGGNATAVMDNKSPALTAADRHAVAVYENHMQDSRVKEVEVAPSLSAKAGTGGGNLPLVQTAAFLNNMSVRLLTPIECERLQGFPDNFTQIPWKGKAPELCPDGPRYKAIGNSMAVPVLKWIGERIEKVERELGK
jgi:DNA (cytosine-5)-methyltransferase 1